MVACVGKLRKLALELCRWMTAGKPYRSNSDINAIFTDICEPCEYFERKSDVRGTCKLCGCKLKKTGKSFNKIAWATSRCPDGRWE